MKINRKHLVRCNAQILKRVVKNNKEDWLYDGFIEFETNLTVFFICESDETLLNDVFKTLVEKHNTQDYKYVYIDFDLEFHNPIKLKGNPVNEYNKLLKIEEENFKNKDYE